jgi:hypothetical protein
MSMRTIASLVLVLTAGSAAAQGTLSTQGLGFPTGQLGTAARTMGGAIGEADPYSALNPAAIGLLLSPIVLMQSEPEYRTLKLGTITQKTSVSRFPLFMGALPLGSRWAIAATASTLLDRTWATTTRDTMLLSGEEIARTFTERSEGSIADLRLALSYAPLRWLRVGIGGHAFSGRDVLESISVFDDSARFARDAQSRTISFGGNAVSVGLQTLWPRVGAIGVDYRRGGALRAKSENDQVVGRGTVPDHYGASLVYLGIRGTTLAVRAARDSWANLYGISPTLNVHEAWDMGVGADVTGPAFGGDSPIALRGGARWRTLPFSADATPIRERTGSFGFALPMAGGRVELNFGALYSTRTGSSSVSESAWTMSTGFAIRP